MRVILLTLLVSLPFSQGRAADGGRAGNGFAVHCTRDDKVGLSEGYYSLDYLATVGLGQSAAVSNWEKSAQRIGKIVQRILPKAVAESYADFVANVLNTDYSKSRVWEKSPFGVLDLSKAQSLFTGHPGQLRSNLRSLVSNLPKACTGVKGVEFVPAVVFLDHHFTGRPDGTLVYKYVPKVIEDLENSSPLQLSYLYIHEWLWDISDSEDRNRRINHFLHSEAIETLSDVQIVQQLKGMGLTIARTTSPTNPVPKPKPPIPSNDFFSIEAEEAFQQTQKPTDRLLTNAEVWQHKHNSSVPAFEWGSYHLAAVQRSCPLGACDRWKVADLIWSRKFDPSIVHPEYEMPPGPGSAWIRWDGSQYVIVKSPEVTRQDGVKSTVILLCTILTGSKATASVTCSDNWMFGGTSLFGPLKPKGTEVAPKFEGGFYLTSGLWLGWAGKHKDTEIRIALQSDPIKKVEHHRVLPEP